MAVKRKRPLLQVTVNEELKNHIVQKAKEQGVSISEYAETLLMKSLGLKIVTQLVWEEN